MGKKATEHLFFKANAVIKKFLSSENQISQIKINSFLKYYLLFFKSMNEINTQIFSKILDKIKETQNSNISNITQEEFNQNIKESFELFLSEFVAISASLEMCFFDKGNFLEDTYIFKHNLYHTNFSQNSLKFIFSDSEKFDRTINILLRNKVIVIENNELVWVKGITRKKSGDICKNGAVWFCALIYYLYANANLIRVPATNVLNTYAKNTFKNDFRNDNLEPEDIYSKHKDGSKQLDFFIKIFDKTF